jgi:outer membrane receptor protein involved in Fe transport
LFGEYSKKLFEELSLKLIVGGQAISNYTKSIGVSTNGIGNPGQFNFVNTATGLFTGSNGINNTRKIGGYGDAMFGYNGYLFLHGSYRTDYTSVFYNESIGFNNPTFSTWGTDLSFVLSDAWTGIKDAGIDLLKLRLSYNKNGNDNLAAYSLQTIYPNATGFPYSGLLGTTVGTTTVSPSLSPEVVKTFEAGFDLQLWKNRVLFSTSIYSQQSLDQILNVSISSASGFTGYLLNAADVNNKGFEMDLKTILFKNRDWELRVNALYSYNENKVIKLYAATGLTNSEYQAAGALASLNATKGEMFPYLKTTVFKRTKDGKIIVNPEDGWPEREDERVGQGTTLPKHQLGLGLNLSYKHFALRANAEYRGGNVMYSDMGSDMSFTGSGAITAIYHRDQFIWPNSVYDDGSGNYVPNKTIAVSPFLANYGGFGDLGFARGGQGVGELYMYSGAFWKLRDVSLEYDFPNEFLKTMNFVRGGSFSIWARNLLTLLPKDNWFADPEFSNTNGNGMGITDVFNTPPVKQIGATLRFNF